MKKIAMLLTLMACAPLARAQGFLPDPGAVEAAIDALP